MAYVTVQTNDRTQVFTKDFYDRVGETELLRIAFSHNDEQEKYEEVVANFVKNNVSFSGITVGEVINV